MAKFIIWYFIVGAGIIVLYGLTSYIGLILKNPLDVVSEAIERVGDEHLVQSHNIIEGIWDWIIILLCWPIRLSNAPKRVDLLWDECEKIKEELKEKDS